MERRGSVRPVCPLTQPVVQPHPARGPRSDSRQSTETITTDAQPDAGEAANATALTPCPGTVSPGAGCAIGTL